MEFIGKAVLAYKGNDVISGAKSGSDALIPDLYEHYSSTLRKGVDSVYFEDNDNPLNHQLKANVSRFATYKAHYVTGVLKNILNDPQIPVKDREAYAKEALKTFDRWQDTEYNTTVSRSRTAKQFAEFNQPDRIRLFPNLRWLASRAVLVRVAHTAFYDRVWAKSDPFWASNFPGSEWECKCGVEETNEGTTDNADVPNVEAPAGLEGNPAFTGEVFTDKASYIKKSKPFELGKETAAKFKNLQSLINTDTEKWRIDYYSDNKGILITNRKRIKESELNSEELAKFTKEHSMCRTLAADGFNVEYRETVKGSFDIYLDGTSADLKKTRSHNHILDYCQHAVKKQGAEIVVFEFVELTPKIHQELNYVKSLGFNIKYFTSSQKKVLSL